LAKEQHMKAIQTQAAPAAIGPYSQAIEVRAGRMLFLSGQIALDPATGQVVPGDVRAQTDRVMRNLQAVLQAAGGELGQLVKTTIFLRDLEDFAAVNEVYAGFLQAPFPARATVQVARLPRDVAVEIDGVAVLPA
jgi:2-iminobutanoate/2-iminopropanoate deaminase